MKTVKVWDKEESINGIEAKRVMESEGISLMEEIFLVLEGERVKEIQRKSIIASNYNIDANLSCLEVAQKYLKIKQQEEQQVQQDIKTLEQQQVEIDALKKQNAELSYLIMQQQGGAI